MDSYWEVKSAVPSGPVGMHVRIRDRGETSLMASKSGAWTATEDIVEQFDNAM